MEGGAAPLLSDAALHEMWEYLRFKGRVQFASHAQREHALAWCKSKHLNAVYRSGRRGLRAGHW